MSPAEPDVTVLLRLAEAGDRDAADRLFRLVEPVLRARAHAYLRRERPGHSLQTTVLVDEAFVRLVGKADVAWADRAHFFGYAARVMRQFLVDRARTRVAQEGALGGAPVALEDIPDPVAPGSLDPATLLAVHEALGRLEGDLPDLHQVVELHVFGELDLKEIAADVLGVEYGKVKKLWKKGRAWLARELSKGGDGP